MTRWMMFVAAALLPALAAAQSTSATPRNPPLETLQIEIWPEYDRPAALVILNGQLAADVALPAPVTLRLPGASGGAHAVASAEREDAPLLNVEHTQKSAGDHILLNFRAPQRFFHVEFYEPIATHSPERRYSYVWPGDLAAARASLMLQEPATASAISMQPEASASATGQNGLRYRSAELGVLEAGKPLQVEVRYSKNDTRTSAEILQPAPAAASPARSDTPAWVFGAAAALAVILAAGSFIFWYERRLRPAAPPPASPQSTSFCAKCGARTAPGDRFCAQCGTRLGQRPPRKKRG